MSNITDEYIIELCRKYSKSICNVSLEEFAAGDYECLAVVVPVYEALGRTFTDDNDFVDKELVCKIVDIISSFDSEENY